MRRLALIVAAVVAALAAFCPDATAAFAAGDEPIVTEELAGGARLILQRRPGCGTFAAQLTVLGGRAEDPAESFGLTDLLARMLLRGTASRSADQQAIEVERTGATLEATSGALGVSLRCSGPAAAASPALDVLLDAASHPRLDPDDLLKEKVLARQRLRASLDIPSIARERAMLPLIFGGHPLGRVADPDAYPGDIGIDALRRAHAERFTSRRAILVVVGDIDADAVRAQTASALGGLPHGAASRAAMPHPDPLAVERRARVRRRASQAELAFAMPTLGVDDAEEPAMDLLAHILGGFQERLSAEIREKRGWAYWLSVLDWRFPGAGAFGILTSVPKRHLEETERIIREELRRISEEPPASAEVDRARRYLLTSLARDWQQSTARAAAFAAAAARGRPPRSYDDLAARYASVTPDQIRALAGRLVEWSRPAVVTLH